MNEVTVTPSSPPKPNIFANKALLFVPVLFILRGSFQGSNSIGKVFESILSGSQDIFTLENLNKKVSVIKRIGPYLPEPTISTLNSLILSYEKISRIMALKDFIVSNKAFEPIKPVNVSSKKESFNRILGVLKEEIPEEKAKTIGPMLDIALNMDKYKGMLNMISTLTESTNKPPHPSKEETEEAPKKKNNQLEDMLNLVAPLLGGDGSKKDDNKTKDMMQMMEIFKVLTSSEKDDSDNKNSSSEKKE